MILGHSLRGTEILIGESDGFPGMFIYLHVAFGTGTAFATYTSHARHHVKRFLHVITSSRKTETPCNGGVQLISRKKFLAIALKFERSQVLHTK